MVQLRISSGQLRQLVRQRGKLTHRLLLLPGTRTAHSTLTNSSSSSRLNKQEQSRPWVQVLGFRAGGSGTSQIHIQTQLELLQWRAVKRMQYRQLLLGRVQLLMPLQVVWGCWLVTGVIVSHKMQLRGRTDSCKALNKGPGTRPYDTRWQSS
jgi:hypothetical protein